MVEVDALVDDAIEDITTELLIVNETLEEVA